MNTITGTLPPDAPRFRPDRSWYARYAFAILAPALATIVRVLLDPALDDRLPLITFYFAVVAVAWTAGFGPTVVATLLSVVLAAYWVLPPSGGFAIGLTANRVGLALFALLGIATGVLSRRAQLADRYRIEIDERARAEDALRESRERLAAALAASGTGTFRWDIATGRLDWDENLDALFGLAPGRSVRSLDQFIALVHPDDREQVIARCARCRDEGADFEMDLRVVTPDGEVRWLADRGRTYRDADGTARYMTGACVDITHRKRAEEALRASEEVARRIVDSSSDCIKVLDLEGRLLSMSAAGLRTMGIGDFAPWRRSSWVDLWHAEDRAAARAALDAATSGHRGAFRGRAATTAGEERWWDVVTTPILGAEGQPAEVLAVSRDVTDAVRVENAIRGSEARWRTLAEALPQLVWATRPDGWCDYLNARWSSYVGEPPESLHGLGWSNAVHPDDRPATLAAWHAAVADEAPYDVEYRLRRHDGTYRWFKARGVPLRDDAGEIVQWFGTSTDIEDVKELQAELRRANARLVASDRRKDAFMATLAHELRNPLGAIRSAVYVMDVAGGDATVVADCRGVIERQLAQAVRVVDDLMDVSRIARGKLDLRIAPTPLRDVVAAAIETARPMIARAGHSLDSSLDALDVVIEADAARLGQVFANLLANAAKYTPAGGHIEVRGEADEQEVVVRVRDSGVGIPPERLSEVFDPFAQMDETRDLSQGGLGIGLALVKRLTEMHRGTVEARSEGANRGSEFVVRLPRAGAAPGGTESG